MVNPNNVALEAAKFLHKLIQESKDEPTKLATKLYVILQHMRSSGKESSMPYQVISRAMETVVKQHGLDIEALMSSRLPVSAAAQVGEAASSQVPGSSQRPGVTRDSKASFLGNEMVKPDAYASSSVVSGPSSSGHGIYQASAPHMSGTGVKVPVMAPSASNSSKPVEPGISSPMHFGSPSIDNHGYAAKLHKDGSTEPFSGSTSVDLVAGRTAAGRALEHEGGSSMLGNASKISQNGENNVAAALLVPSCSSHKRDSLNCKGTVQVDPLLPHPIGETVTNRGTVNVDVAHDDHIEDTSEMMQLDSHFEQPNLKINSAENARSNDNVEHSDYRHVRQLFEAEAINRESNFVNGATTNSEKICSQKNNTIQRIEKDHGITRKILEQRFGMTLEDAAKNLCVSRATLKRICRGYNISRWPNHKTRKVNVHVSQRVSFQAAEPYVGDQQCPALSQEKGTDCLGHKRSPATGKPCDSMMTVKVTYRGDIIKFQLPLSSTKVELEGEVEKRLKISLQKFSIKYQDEDDDWILITTDSDLRDGMHSLRLLGRTTMRLLVTPEADT